MTEEQIGQELEENKDCESMRPVLRNINYRDVKEKDVEPSEPDGVAA